MRGVMMRPVNDGFAAVCDIFPAYVHRVAGRDRNARCQRHIIDDVDRAGRGLNAEFLVRAVGARAQEKAWRRRDDPGKIDFGAASFGNCAGQIHVRPSRPARAAQGRVARSKKTR